MKVGDTIWVFDETRRIYPRPEPGRRLPSSGPIWREHWVPVQIVSETSRSWVLQGGGTKVPKNGSANPHLFCYSHKDLDELCWVREHAWKIAKRVDQLRTAADYSLLRRVAFLIGYSEEPA